MSDFATTYAAALAAHPDIANSVHGRVVSRALADPDTPHHQRVLARAEEQTVEKYGTPGDWTEFWLVVERIAAVLSIIVTLMALLAPEPMEVKPMTIVLATSDGNGEYGSAEVQSDSPGLPQTVTWKGKVFAVNPKFGGGPTIYTETSNQNLPDDAVTTPGPQP